MQHEKIKTYDYLKGTDFTENLKKLTRSKNFRELSSLLDIPGATLSSWNRNQRTPYEVIARVHLAMDIPVKDLALPQHIQATEVHTSLQYKRPMLPAVRDTENNYEIALSDQQHTQRTTVIYCYPMAYPIRSSDHIRQSIRKQGSEEHHASLIEHAAEIETKDSVYLINSEIHHVDSGHFLLDINGKIHIQNLRSMSGRPYSTYAQQSLNIHLSNTIKILGYVVAIIRKSSS
ncbi:Bacteriophage CI repressor helix-turn-helix domain protein [Vibrio aerogenes CECT 7868]|uniref:Bacteriophage CI repressor helix-turn-helix domain protein n=1 Tax=Vibrio aerogenes CECT 7868 TaxID=1216006 RepID=A0A1M5VSI7_9VIBR|nr:helix-turn-helix domain-containing protein [Vibrio aerogenes]SHH78150.1 Bacteriophage CI repressor helix-turn-helix domain protein [Vibrio aerogenes CECT 7868]